MPDDEDWFSILVLHQNRTPRGPKNFIPESMIPGFIRLVIWGHEHDCKIIPEEIVDTTTFISQPGNYCVIFLRHGLNFIRYYR